MNTSKGPTWFKHDTRSLDDPKMIMLVSQLGPEAYGVYWMLMERLSSQPGYMLPLCTIDPISRMIGISQEKLKAIIEKYGLFEVDNDEKNFYSPELIFGMKAFEKNIQTKRKNAKNGWTSRRAIDQQKRTHAAALQPHSDRKADAKRMQSGCNEDIDIDIDIDLDKEKDLNKEEKKRISESQNDSEPLSFFSKDILKLYNWCVKGKLPNSRESVFPERSIPKTKKDIHDWMKCIHDLVNIDGYTLQDVNRAIIYAREDQFWKNNFLSLLKLRRKDKDKIRYIDKFIPGWNKDNKDKPLPGEDAIQMMMRQMKEQEEHEELNTK
jgi:hypothetical protein